MKQKFERGIEGLFDAYHAAQKAELAGNQKLADAKFQEGLEKSCEILQFMVSDKLLLSAHPRQDAWMYFERLSKSGKLELFLDAEKKILRTTSDLRADIVEIVINSLRHVIAEGVKQKKPLDPSWAALLSQVSAVVCKKGSAVAPGMHARPYLKRAALAAGGGLVAVVNILVGSNRQIQAAGQPLLQLSVDAGIWLIGWAAVGILDKWADSGSRP